MRDATQTTITLRLTDAPTINEAVRELAIEQMILSAKPGYNDPTPLEVPKMTPEEKARIREKTVLGILTILGSPPIGVIFGKYEKGYFELCYQS